MSDDIENIMQQLAEPFAAEEVEFKPQAVKGNRALAVAYVDARTVMDRLDRVLGIGGWQTTFRKMGEGVVCHLRVRIAGEWTDHEDVGNYSDQPDPGDKLKAACSDALKRVAVHLGIGRYLYRLSHQWCDFDPQKKGFVKTPTLPGWALPKKKPANPPPANGAELRRRLLDYQDRLVAQGVCKPGELLHHVQKAGAKAGHIADLSAWTGAAIQLAVDETKAFEALCRQRKAAPEQPAKPEQQPAEEAGDAAEQDPAETITVNEVRELVRLMKLADRKWPQCQAFLKVGSTVKVEQLSYAQHGRLKKALEERIPQTAGV